MIREHEAVEVLETASTKTILVVGDLMLDRFVFGNVSRISPEAPVPVVHVTEEKNMPGGAANVALNLRAFGVGAQVAGFVGDDRTGEELIRVLSDDEINTQGVQTVAGAETIMKTRVIAARQQVCRVDREDLAGLRHADIDTFSALVRDLVASCDGVIIEDYGKGVVTQATVDAVVAAARGAGVPVGVDPKDNHELSFDGITVATPNLREAILASRGVDDGESAREWASDELQALGNELLAKWSADLVMITLGPQGMFLASKDGMYDQIPTHAREVFDVSGAGDTVIALTVLALACDAGHRLAAELANHAAGIVVGKVGTATCSPEELRASIVRGESGTA